MAEIIDNHRFARHCSGIAGKDFNDEDDGYHQPPWLYRGAFSPSPHNPDISGLWVEAHDGTAEQQIQKTKDEFIFSTRKIRKKHVMAVIEAGRARILGQRYSRFLQILHDPDLKQNLPSHASIRGIMSEDRILQQKLADSCEIFKIFP